jgi:hypothetical protein
MINAYKMLLVVQPEGKSALERLISGWEDNIKMDLKELGCEGVDWFQMTQDRDQLL